MIDTSKFGAKPSGAVASQSGAAAQPTGAYNPADPNASFTMPAQQFNAPGMDQWSKAADLYGYASLPQGDPRAWGTAENAYNQMLGGGGNAVDVTGWWNAQQPQFQTQMSDMAKQAAETAGMGGMRWSSPLATNIADQTSRGLQNLTADFAGRQISADEAARQRMMESMSGLSNLGQGQANLGLANTQNMFTGAGGLASIGDRQFQAPMQAAQALQNSGQNMYNQQNSMLQGMYTPPWMQGAMGAAQGSAYGTPQTYQPSFGENMFGIAGSLLPYANFGGQNYEPYYNWGQPRQ
jgi:hypothetical protein